MKTTTRTRIRRAAALAGLAVAPASVLAQEVCEGTVRGDLGIQGLACDGRCVVALQEDEDITYWSFSTEPRIVSVDPEGPTAGVLRPGDRIVAVGDALITTRVGGERFGSLEPGSTVRLRYRRNGRVLTSDFEVAQRCEPTRSDEELAEIEAVERALAEARASRESQRNIRLEEARRRLAELQARAEQARDDERTELLRRIEETQAALSAALALPPPAIASPGATLGFSFRCDDCSAQVTDTGTRWRFARPIEVYRVQPGGAADRAGIREGDLIREIDGMPIESREGAERFADVKPGDEIRLTLSRPDGSFANIKVAPRASAAPPRADGGTVIRAPWSPGEGPLRFTGAVGEATVVVRGAPVNVVRDQAAGVLIIRTGDTEVRITVPPSGEPPRD